MRQFCSTLCVILVLLATARAGESRPSSAEALKNGVERGRALRKQSALLPGVLHRYALIMKVGGVRCGHAVVSLEDAKGEGGAVYKLVEQFKAAMVAGDSGEVIDYSGTFLLSAELGLLSGQMRAVSETIGKSERQAHEASARMSIKEETLSWDVTEQIKGIKTAPVTTTRTLPLFGQRPVPRNALLSMAALAIAQNQKFTPNGQDAICVPSIDLNWEMDQFDVEPAWIVFDGPALKHKTAAMQMRLRYLSGELTGKGLEAEPPAPEQWRAVQIWPLDAQGRPLAHPAPDDPRLTVEGVDPATIDVNAALDLEKIGAASKAQ